MSREVHVRFWESAGVRFPRATQHTHALAVSTIDYLRSLIHVRHSFLSAIAQYNRAGAPAQRTSHVSLFSAGV